MGTKENAKQVGGAGFDVVSGEGAIKLANDKLGKTGAGRDVAKTYNDFNSKMGVSKEHDIAGQYARGNYAKGTLNALVGAPGWSALTNFFKGPEAQYWGGSKEALAAGREAYAGGIAGGQGLTGQGVGTVGGGLGQIGAGAGTLAGAVGGNLQDRSTSISQMDRGRGLLQSGMDAQNRAVGEVYNMADRRGPSVVDAQTKAALDQNSRNMMGAASGSGSQLAMSNALNATAEAGVQASQQSAALKAQEENDYQARRMQARTFGANVFGQQSGIGASMYSQGIGNQMMGTGQLGQLGGAQVGAGQAVGSLGLGLGQLGNQQQSTYVTGLQGINDSQLGADNRTADGKVAAKDRIIGSVGQGIGAMFGG